VILDQNFVTRRTQLIAMGLQALQDQRMVGNGILAEFLDIAGAGSFFGTGLRIGGLAQGLLA
jgi:hypothetical protein